jgi:SAM-dependent methyltransferase
MSGSSSESGFRAESLGLWDRMAAGWERDGDSIWAASRAVGEWMVAAVRPGAGDTVLELAAGPGDTGFVAASLVGDSGRLICTDFAPEMVAVARSRGAALGLANVEYHVLDAERIELDSESVDCVLCRWGYMLMENPTLALRETRRVLRSGGRLALSVWGEPADNAWASVPAAVLVDGGWLEPPLPGAPGIFALAAPERLRHVLAVAGFNDPQLDQIDVVWPFASFDAYWQYLCGVAGAIAIVLEGLGDSDRATARDQIRNAIEPYRAGAGYELPGRCLNASARRDRDVVQGSPSA